MRPLAALLASVCLLSVIHGAGQPRQPTRVPWTEVALVREELPADDNVLTRWRPLFPRLFPEDAALAEQLHAASSPLTDLSGPEGAMLRGWLAEIQPLLDTFALREHERLQLPPLSGPETPFPDHHPLRQIAQVRSVALKAAWRDGGHEEALGLALENLRLARTLFAAQEGVIPLLNTSAIWQQALDDVYWLARQADLNAAAATRLQQALFRDEHLAANALIRAFRGEFTFFTLTTIDRLPRTNDVELFLSSIGSLGLAPATSPESGEPRLAIPDRSPFDREATLQAAADDVAGWVGQLTRTPRYPRGFMTAHTHRRLRAYAEEIPLLLGYAVQEEPPTHDQARAVDEELARLENPVGKLFLIITTTQWDPIVVSLFRREAQRAALTGLLAWRRLGHPAPWRDLATAGLLPTAPADPFSTTLLSFSIAPPRIWSVAQNGTDEGGAGNGENLGRPDDLVWPAQ